ncbi:MAG: sigma-70 family RNA polymerase sigma factor [Anditalea sp.]
MSSQDPLIVEKLFADLKQSKANVPLEDVQVWNAFREGNETAFVFIYETNFERLYAYGLRIAAEEYLVEDAIQELFIYLKNNRNRLSETDSIKFYLFKCLKRKLHREASKWLYKRQDFTTRHNFDFTVSHEQHLIDKQIDEDKLDRLNRAIQLLSPRKKEVIYYFFYEELDYPQIQEIMGLESLKTTRNLLYKALNFLRETLG